MKPIMLQLGTPALNFGFYFGTDLATLKR